MYYCKWSCVLVLEVLKAAPLCCGAKRWWVYAVREFKSSGRFLVAAEQLDAGQVLIQEEPFVAVLAKARRSQARRSKPPLCKCCSGVHL